MRLKAETRTLTPGQVWDYYALQHFGCHSATGDVEISGDGSSSFSPLIIRNQYHSPVVIGRLAIRNPPTAAGSIVVVMTTSDVEWDWAAGSPINVNIGSAMPTGANHIGEVDAIQRLFNGTDYDDACGNLNDSTGDTGAKVASGNGATQTNVNAKGAVLLFDVADIAGTDTPSITFRVQGSADGGTTWFDLPGAATAAITAAGQTVLAVCPGITAAANAAVAYPLPRTWRVAWAIAGTDPSITITGVQIAYVV